MSDYDDTNRGALFKNVKKETEQQPDYKGNLNVGGVEYWVSSWLKVSKTGEKYMSLSVTAKDAPKPAQTKPAPVVKQSLADMDDEIPFISNVCDYGTLPVSRQKQRSMNGLHVQGLWSGKAD